MNNHASAPVPTKPEENRVDVSWGKRLPMYALLLTVMGVVLVEGQGHDYRFNLMPYAVITLIAVLLVADVASVVVGRRKQRVHVPTSAEEDVPVGGSVTASLSADAVDPAGGTGTFGAEQRRRALIVCVGLVVLVVLPVVIPFAVAMAVFLLVALRFGARWPIWSTLLSGVGMYLFLDVLINDVLGVTFPQSFFSF